MAFAGINTIAIFLAAAAGWMVGAIWYTALGKYWIAALGVSRDEIVAARRRPGGWLPFVLAFVACVVMAWVLAGAIGHLGPGQVTVRNGIISAAFCWAGFVITTMLVNNSFAGRRPLLLLIDGAHWLLVLVVMGAIIGTMGV